MVMVIDQNRRFAAKSTGLRQKSGRCNIGCGWLQAENGIILDKHRSKNCRLPISLLGKVYCKADAQYGAIEVGDFLTTSPSPGHGMKSLIR